MKLIFFGFESLIRRLIIRPRDLTAIAVNLDTQQIVLTHGIGSDEYHISRFNRLTLYKENQTVQISRVVPFERGESNFNTVQLFLGSRYTELERAKQLNKKREELAFLASRNIMSGDLMSHMVLSNMKALGVLPLEVQCIGFDPTHVNNASAIHEMFGQWLVELKETFTDIIDVSTTQQFTSHNFSRRSKQMQSFLAIKSISDMTPDRLLDLTKELEELTQYMDDFFKLNLYDDLDENLECETIPEDNQDFDEAQETSVNSEQIDDDSKKFISENFVFFQKRSKVQSALLKIERMLFYNQYIKPVVEKKDFEPDLIVYNSGQSLTNNFQYASYPALAIGEVLNQQIFKSDGEEVDLFFVKQMRGFTQKVRQAAQKLKKSFHHQYKHTLAELQFKSSEKLQRLQAELAFLDDPKNREQAYIQLLERITKLYHKHLDGKRSDITRLDKELVEVKTKKEETRGLLADLLEITIEPDDDQSFLSSVPDRMEKLRLEAINQLNQKKPGISAILLPYSKFYASITQYYNKILSNANWFQKALLIRRKHQMVQAVKKQSEHLFEMTEEERSGLINRLKKKKYDAKAEKHTLSVINQNSRELKEIVVDLKHYAVTNLFQSKTKNQENLLVYMEYFSGETKILQEKTDQISTIFNKLNRLEKMIFKQLEEITNRRIQYSQNLLLLKTARLIQKSTDDREAVNELLSASETVPKNIKDELGDMRIQMNSAFEAFSKATDPSRMTKFLNLTDLIRFAEQREKIGNSADELGTYIQRESTLGKEIEGEKEDLEYLVSQEENLEKVAMSKALPSTRALLKNQYIPLMEKEIAQLSRTNSFLGEIISNDQKLKDALSSTFFRNRYGYLQFCNGVFCIDHERGAKTHTEKNVNSAITLLSEKFKKSLTLPKENASLVELKKIIVMGTGGVKEKISAIWNKKGPERFIFLPGSYDIITVLSLCDYKAEQIKQNPQEGKSNSSLILIYISEINFRRIKKDTKIMEQYHRAIMSNIFIDIDGVDVFNNRQSIYESCVREMFGRSNENGSSQIVQNFLMA